MLLSTQLPAATIHTIPLFFVFRIAFAFLTTFLISLLAFLRYTERLLLARLADLTGEHYLKESKTKKVELTLKKEDGLVSYLTVSCVFYLVAHVRRAACGVCHGA